MTYEKLQLQNNEVPVKEMNLSEVSGLKGLYYNGNIAIEKNLTSTEKTCVLAEELGIIIRPPETFSTSKKLRI